jgi:hypothetical protein
MRKLTAALALALLGAVTVGAQKQQNDRETEGLKGPVKVVALERASLEAQGGRVAEGRRLMSDRLTFDAGGVLAEREEYSIAGVLLRKIVYGTRGGDRVGERVQRARAVDGYLVVAPPAGSGRARGDDTRRVPESYKYKYDEQGRIREWVVEQRGVVNMRIVYNFEGDRREVVSYLGGKSLFSRLVETLDARGNVVEATDFDVQTGAVNAKFSYGAYEYDAHGNWVKRVVSKQTGEGAQARYEPAQAEYRTITYF